MAELRELAASVRSTSLGASAAFAEGVLAGASGDGDLAQRSLGDAAGLFERAGSPFDSARARLALADSLSVAGKTEAALREARSALDTFASIGAAKETARAEALLRRFAQRREAGAGKSPDTLTAREVEILSLLADGQSNQQIADLLVLSVRTVERHISNIYEKLGLDGRNARAAAAAYAHRAAITNH
jgi:ATP/maltotriose-dependent transcriptional regulator MalT